MNTRENTGCQVEYEGQTQRMMPSLVPGEPRVNHVYRKLHGIYVQSAGLDVWAAYQACVNPDCEGYKEQPGELTTWTTCTKFKGRLSWWRGRWENIYISGCLSVAFILLLVPQRKDHITCRRPTNSHCKIGLGQLGIKSAISNSCTGYYARWRTVQKSCRKKTSIHQEKEKE